MTLATSSVRTLGALSAGLLALGMLVACTPGPEPEPAPTKTALFSSDEEAFAAAEETYRAYTDAENDFRRGGTQDPQDYLTGSALQGYIDGVRLLDEAGLSLEGDIAVVSFTGTPGSVDGRGRHLSATVCLDISQTTTHSATGGEIPDRPPVVAQEIEMTWFAEGFRISEEAEGDVERCDG